MLALKTALFLVSAVVQVGITSSSSSLEEDISSYRKKWIKWLKSPYMKNIHFIPASIYSVVRQMMKRHTEVSLSFQLRLCLAASSSTYQSIPRRPPCHHSHFQIQKSGHAILFANPAVAQNQQTWIEAQTLPLWPWASTVAWNFILYN